jgi:hypothetical protein
MGALFTALLPLHRFDRAPTTQKPNPSASQGPLGVFPFLCLPPRGKKRRGMGERREEAERWRLRPVMPSMRQDRRPFAFAGSRTRRDRRS